MNIDYIKNLIMTVDEINRKSIKTDGLNQSVNPRFKIIEKKGCSHCINSKNLLKEKNIEFIIKQKLSPEEEKIIIDQTGKKYKFYPKIFELKECGDEYSFLGGFNELEERLK